MSKLQRRIAEGRDEGFTLIELLIVIVVLGILAAVVVFALGSVTGNAKASACNADAKTVTTAVQAYNAKNAPATIGYETVTGGIPGTSQQDSLVSGGYLNSWPTNTNGYSLRLANTDDAASDPTVKAGDVMVTTGTGTSAVTVDYNSQGTGGCNSL